MLLLSHFKRIQKNQKDGSTAAKQADSMCEAVGFTSCVKVCVCKQAVPACVYLRCMYIFWPQGSASHSILLTSACFIAWRVCSAPLDTLQYVVIGVPTSMLAGGGPLVHEALRLSIHTWLNRLHAALGYMLTWIATLPSLSTAYCAVV